MSNGHEWYVDCYCGLDAFPVNSFGPMTLDSCVALRNEILGNQLKNGIARVEITKRTLGQSPMRVTR